MRATVALLGLIAVVAPSWAGRARADDGRAKEAEEQAFTAIEATHYCEAMALFLRADALAPSPDYLFNAANAAQVGGDRMRALALFATVLSRYTDAAQRAGVRKQMDALTKKIEVEGPGAACPAPSPVDSAAAAAPTTAPLPGETPAPAPAPAAAAPETTASPSLWPWAAIAGGSTLVVAGAASITYLGVVRSRYVNTANSIRTAESNDDLATAVDLQETLANARNAHAVALPLASVGGVLAVAGIGLGVLGGVLLANEAP